MIEHTPDPAAVVGSVSGLLRPGGALVLTTPQPRSTLELACKVAFLPGPLQLARLVYREPILPTGHISLVSAREVGAMLAEAGLAVLEKRTGGLYLPGLAEAGGRAALRLEKALERRLAGTRLSGALWTQYWIAERPAG